MRTETDWKRNPQWDGKLSLLNASFLLFSPLLALAGLPYFLSDFHWSDFAIFFFMMQATGLAITAGYHRLLSHQSYEASPIVRFLLLCFGAAAFQNSALKWSSDHRYHHRFVDGAGDPYNINKGFFHAHMGWIFLRDPEGRSYDNVKDLASDPLIAWQERHYWLIGICAGFLFPLALGFLWGRPLEALFWGGLVRVVYVHHGTFFINSLAHVAGSRPFSKKVSAGDSWWLAFFTNGEGYHNFHHVFANDYRNGRLWYQWDPTKWLINFFVFLGQASNLNRTPEAHILRAQLSVTVDDFTKRGLRMPTRLEEMRLTLEQKLLEFQNRAREFQQWKSQKLGAWEKLQARYGRKRLRFEKRILQTQLAEFKAHLRLARKNQMVA
jgi:stearoyl-CoA desaturase (Delta-9 desaturase)